MIALYIVSCIFDAFVIYLLFESFFEKRKEQAGVLLVCAGLLGQQGITTFLLNYTESVYVRLLAQIVGVFFITLFYKGSFVKHILGMAIFVCFSIIAEGMAEVSANLMGIESNEEEKIVLLFLVEVFLLILVLFTKLFSKKESNIPTRYQLGFMVVPVLSVVIINGMISEKASLFWLMGLISLLLMNMVSYYLLNTLAGYVMERNMRNQMEQQIEMQKEKYEQLSASFIKGNRLIHDINKHHRILKEYLLDSKENEAIDYLQKIDGTFEHLYSTVNTGNLVIDAVMGRYKDLLEQHGCRSKIKIDIDKNRRIMDDYDLVVILGNITDNIIEAVTGEGIQEHVFAEVELKMTKTMVIFHSRNSICLERKAKKNMWYHGLGLKNVKDTVEKYGGSMVVNATENDFETMIQIPLKE